MELVKKITAPNPGVFTGGGTNTYLVGREDLTLIDPGPNIKEHIDEIIRAGENKIKRILVNYINEKAVQKDFKQRFDKFLSSIEYS